MRLEVTRRADLAVQAVGLLAERGQMKGSDLAAALDASPGFMPQVVGPLVKAGWVRSEPGPTGGYVLDEPRPRSRCSTWSKRLMVRPIPAAAWSPIGPAAAVPSARSTARGLGPGQS